MGYAKKNEKYKPAFEQKAQPLHENYTDNCRTMWASVIMQAVVDAKSNSRRYRHERQEALAWLEGDEESGFGTVCDLAGFDFKVIRKRIKVILADPHYVLDFRILRKNFLGCDHVDSRRKYLRRSRVRELARRVKLSGQDNTPLPQVKRKAA